MYLLPYFTSGLISKAVFFKRACQMEKKKERERCWTQGRITLCSNSGFHKPKNQKINTASSHYSWQSCSLRSLQTCISEYWMMLLWEVHEQAPASPGITALPSADRCITLFHACFCSNTPCLIYNVGSLTLDSQPAAPELMPECAYLTQVYSL